MMRQWPAEGSKDDLYEMARGVNNVDELPKMPLGFAQMLQDMEYRNETLVRRPPFLEYNTDQLQAELSNGMEYVDNDDTAHLILASMDGKIKKRTSAGVETDLVTGLTEGRRASLVQMLGAAFHQNGVDSPRRLDGTTPRVAGAPSAAGTLSLGAASAGALTGEFIWIVVACIHDGTSVILESDHSGTVKATLTSQQQALSWVVSSDSRVNRYRVYRTKDKESGPYYLVVEQTGTTYTDNTLDTALSATKAAPITRNGTMPVSRIVVQAGQRLVCAGLVDSSDPAAAKAVHLSIIATNRHEMEYFPTDGNHKLYLPGVGKVTAAFGISNKDEDEAAKDVFLSQPSSCYILRKADPYGILEPISFERGAISDRAATQWGRWLFFVSKEGLEFVGPDGELKLITRFVQSWFKGGGPLSLNAPAGDDYITLAIHENRLLITIRDDSAHAWGNKTLVMHLEFFNPFAEKPEETAVFTEWKGEGLGHAFYVPLRDGTLVLVDNKNRRLLKRGTTGPADMVAGASINILARIWTGGLNFGAFGWLKVLRQINVLQLSDKDTTMDLEADFGRRRALDKVIPRNIEVVVWNKPWNKAWARANVFLSTLLVSRQMRGRFFQAKIKINNASERYVFVGMAFFFSAVKVRRMVKR